jgi:hypothetical protein
VKQEVIQVIQARFRSDFEKEAASINSEFDDVLCTVDSFVSTNGDYSMMSLGCVLGKADQDKSDSLSVGIDIELIDGQPTMTADVAWGPPFSKAVGAVFDLPVEVNEDNLDRLQTELPRLFFRNRQELRNNPRGRTNSQ